jgi:hypothetical protein
MAASRRGGRAGSASARKVTRPSREDSQQGNRREQGSAKQEGAVQPDCTDFARLSSLFGSDSGLLRPFAFANSSRSVLSKPLILLNFTGAGGENRTHDLPLTKGLRYHYATPASVGGDRPVSPEERLLYPIVYVKGKGSCVAVSPKSPEARERLAAALRENLKRRKARARALNGDPADTLTGAGSGHDEDGAAPPPGQPDEAAKQG